MGRFRGRAGGGREGGLEALLRSCAYQLLHFHDLDDAGVGRRGALAAARRGWRGALAGWRRRLEAGRAGQDAGRRLRVQRHQDLRLFLIDWHKDVLVGSIFPLDRACGRIR